MLSVSRITNANLFINGKNLLGMVEELSLPDVNAIMSDHKAIGMFAKLQLPSGLDKMEAKIKWNSYYPTAMGFALDIYTACQLQVRASVEGYGGAGRSSQLPLVTIVNGTFMNLPLGAFKQHDNVEFESKFNVTSITQKHNGVEILVIDVLANIYRVNGVDKLAQYKLNTGAQ